MPVPLIDDGAILGGSDIGATGTAEGESENGLAAVGATVGEAVVGGGETVPAGDGVIPAGDSVVGPADGTIGATTGTGAGTDTGDTTGDPVGLAVGRTMGDGATTEGGGVGSSTGAVMGLRVPPNTGNCAKKGANPGTVGCARTKKSTLLQKSKNATAARRRISMR